MQIVINSSYPHPYATTLANIPIINGIYSLIRDTGIFPIYRSAKIIEGTRYWYKYIDTNDNPEIDPFNIDYLKIYHYDPKRLFPILRVVPDTIAFLDQANLSYEPRNEISVLVDISHIPLTKQEKRKHRITHNKKIAIVRKNNVIC